MPTYLQPVDIPTRCFLGEALLWVAVQRLPVAWYNFKGEDKRETFDAGGLEAELPEWELTEEETQRANIPPDPTYLALIQEKPTLLPAFYDDLIKRYNPEPEERARLEEERAKAEIYERECANWQPLFQQAVEYPASRIFVALRGGQLKAMGRLLPGGDKTQAHDSLSREDKDVFDFPVAEVPSAFWTLSGMDFKASAAGNGPAYYCHISCMTSDVLALFPGDREQIAVERVGDCFVLNDASPKKPTHSTRGRPAYPWEPFHLEVATLLQRGELPSKKEAAIQHFQSWFESHLGVEPSRAAIGERLKPYYDKFGRREGQKISK